MRNAWQYACEMHDRVKKQKCAYLHLVADEKLRATFDDEKHAPDGRKQFPVEIPDADDNVQRDMSQTAKWNFSHSTSITKPRDLPVNWSPIS